MMTVRVQSIFDCPPDKVWAELQTSALHREIIRPLLSAPAASMWRRPVQTARYEYGTP
jgi:hypothetical protein